MDIKITVLLTAAVFALFVAFLGRYELVAVPAGGAETHGYAYRLDRWTGEIAFIAGRNSHPIEIN